MGGFNYVLKEDDNLINENVEREYGWCYDCEYICPIEIIPTIDSLEIKIEKLKSRYDGDKLELTKKENRLIKFKSTKKKN